jgi:hypothetical protein
MATKIKEYETADVVYLKLGYPSKEALLKACQRREIPHIRRSPRVTLFDPDEINRFLEERAVTERRQFHVVANRGTRAR